MSNQPNQYSPKSKEDMDAFIELFLREEND